MSQNPIGERVTAVEEQVKNVGDDVREIKNNHLPHIQADLDMLKRYLFLGLGALGAVQLVVQYIK